MTLHTDQPEFTPHERATGMAQLYLRELVTPSGKVTDEQHAHMGSRLKDVCAEHDMDFQGVLTSVMHSMCRSNPAFADQAEQLARRARVLAECGTETIFRMLDHEQ